MTEHFSESIRASAVTPSQRILRLPDVISRVGLRRASIYLHMTKGSFPKPISLGARAVGWLESDIDGWIAARIEVTRRAGK
jgi:prophage regulatory protein